MTLTDVTTLKNAHELRVLFKHRAKRFRYDDVREAIDVRDDIVAWARSPRNQFELHHRDTDHAGYLYETEAGWVLNVVISYQTATGDGDLNDVKRGVQRVLDSHRAGEIVHVRRKRVKA